MFRHRKAKRDGDKTSEHAPVIKVKKRASELAEMIQKVQQSADVVEKDILDTEEKLNFDIENARNNKDFQYKQRNSDNLAEAEKYLQELFLNVDQVKKMKHPQSEMIKKDVHQLHDRWDKLCAEYRRVYEQVYVHELRPKVDWLKLVEEKQYSVNRKGFGNDLVTVEKQLAEHNIIHKEIEAYHPHIRELEASPEYENRLKDSYKELLSTSGQRDEDLNTLHVFMQSCTQQLMWLDMEQEERKHMDWSDRNTDYDSRSRKYEDIVNKDIVEKEMAVNAIQDEGERLLNSNHPAKGTIMAHMDALDSDWKKYLNLLICEEAHLRFMSDYHKFRKDVNEVKDQIDKRNKEVDRRYRLDSKDSAFRIEALLYDIQEKQKETDSVGEAVQALQARSHQIVPLKYRHEKVLKPLPVEALCDFEEDEMTVQRGDKVILKDNMDPVTWLVADSSGMTKPIPSACLVIPPTDSESIALADGLTDQYSQLRKRLSNTDGMFRKRLSEVQQSPPSLSVETDDKDEKECVQYISDLEKVYFNMDDLERKMLFNLRTPLEKSNRAGDARDRVKEHQEFVKQLKILQSDKNKAKNAAESFLKRTPKCSSSPKLYSKIDENEEKYNKVSRLTVDYGEKVNAANSLENNLKKTNEMLLPSERALAQEFTLPGDVRGIRARRQELKTIKDDLRKKQQITDETVNDLRNTKQQCTTISTQYNEQCPDISRQENQLRRLQSRHDESLQETEERLKALEECERLQSNYNTSYNNLDTWLKKLPKPELTDHETPESLQKKVVDQTKLVDEIRSKGKDETATENLGHEYFSLIQDYEKSADRYRYTVEEEVPVSRSTVSQEQQSPGENLQAKERDLSKRYTEASVANEQHLILLKKMQSLQKQGKETNVQQTQARGQWTEKDGQSDLQRLYGEEMNKRKHLEGELDSIQNKTREEHETLIVRERKIKELELKLSQPTDKVITDEKVIIKEVAMERRDLEEELEQLKIKLAEEKNRNKTANEEITLIKGKSNALEQTKPKMENQHVTQTAVKSDPGMLKETELLKQRLSDLQNENSDLIRKVEKEQKETENKMHLMQKKIHELQQQPKLDERVIIKEVAKIEKDPATEEELTNLRNVLEDERKKNKAVNEEINRIQKKYITLEQSKQKVLREEVVTRDPEVEKVVANLKKQVAELQQKLRDKETEIDRVQKEMLEYKKQTSEGKSSKETVERNFAALQKRVHETEHQPPTLDEKVIIKEVAKVEKDPQMEEDLRNLSKMLEDEKKKNKAAKEEINLVQKKYITLEQGKPKEVVKADPEVERMAAILKKQLADREKEIDRLQKEMLESKKKADDERSSKETIERNFTIFQNKVHETEKQPPILEEKVIIKEVAKVEKDPQMEEDLRNLSNMLEDEKKKNKAAKEEINLVQKKYITLEQGKPKVVTKEVVKADPEVERMAAILKKQLADREKEIERLQKEMLESKKKIDEERSSKETVERNFAVLQKRVDEIEKQPPTLDEKVIIKEVAKVEKDPQMEEDLRNLSKMLEDEKKKNKAAKEEINLVQKKYITLEQGKPKVVTKEVVKADPEVERMAAILKKQLADREKEIDRLQKEMLESKKKADDERSSKETIERNFTIFQNKVHETEKQPPILEEKVIIKEVAKVEKDPQMEEDLRNLRNMLEDEKKKNKAAKEEINLVQKKYITLEQGKPKEVVKADPEVERMAAILKKQLADREKEIDRLQKEMLESKKKADDERSSKETIERNFAVLQKRVDEIEKQPPTLDEKVIIKEVAKVEKDPQMEEDLRNLSNMLEDEKKKNKAAKEEINLVQKKYITLEQGKPKVVTKEVVKADPEVERMAAILKKQLADREKEIERLQKEMLESKKKIDEERSSKETVERNFTVLQNKVHETEKQPPILEEKVIIKEVAKVEKDPQMEEDLRNLRNMLEDEKKKNKAAKEEINLVQKKYITLEQGKPKVVTKEVVKADPEVERMAAILKKQLADREKEIDGLQKEMLESKKQTGEERSSKETVERKFAALQKRVYEIEQQPPTLDEKVIIKEVAKVEKDPQMEEDLRNLSKMLEDEKKKNKAAKEEINLVQKKYITLEQGKPKVVTKEVVKADPEVERMAAILKKQLADKEKEIDRLQKEMLESKKKIDEERSSKETVERNFTVLQNKVHETEKQPPILEEKVIIKEVAKVEKDPQMEEDLRNLRNMLEDEKKKNKAAKEEINLVQKKYITLEQGKPKVVTKEVVKADPEVERMAAILKKQLADREKEIDGLQKEMLESKKQTGEERSSKETVERKFAALQKTVYEIEQQPPTLDEKVIIKEVAKVEKDPQMEEDLRNLSKMLEDEKKKNKAAKEEINLVQKKYITLEQGKPKVVTKEVVKADPEVERMAAILKKQLADREKEIDRLQKEMLESKKQTGEERSSKETVERKFAALQKTVYEIEQQPPKLDEKVIIKEVAKVEKDPQMEEDLRNLSKMLEDEKKKNKAAKEEINLVQKKYITLEQGKPKVVTKEVVKADPEVERMAAILKKQLADKEKEIDRLQKEMLESKKKIDEERSSKETVERNFTVLQNKVHETEKQPPILEEKVIIKEVAKVEKDPQMEEDLRNLRNMLEDEKKKNKAAKEEINLVQKKYITLEQGKPKVVTKEVVKADPEVERMAAILKKQLADREKEIDGLQKEMLESKKQTGEERSSKETVERKFAALQKRVYEIEQQPPMLDEKVIIKEVAKVEKDPQMEEDLRNLSKMLEDEKKKNKAAKEEINLVQKKYITLEQGKPKVVTKEVVKADPEVERMAAILKKQLADREKEIDRLQKEMLESKKQTGEERSSKETVERKFSALQKRVYEIEQQPPTLDEKVIIKEVAKVEKDPQMEEDLRNLSNMLEDEKKKNKAAKEEINLVQKKYITLEQGKPKVVTKEVVKADPEVERMAAILKKQLADREKEIDGLQKEMLESKKQTGEERSSKETVERKFAALQKRLYEIEQQPPTLDEKVIIKEVAKVEKDPQMEEDLKNLSNKLEDEEKKNKAAKEEINLVQKKYITLEQAKPKEVVKADPEVERMAAILKKQLADREKEIDRLQKEMLESKKQTGEERSSKETVERNFAALQKRVYEIEQQPPTLDEKVIIKEVAKVEKDPQMEEDLRNLSNMLEDEKKKNKAAKEEINIVQKKYITLEQGKPKVVTKEVVKADPEVERMAAILKKQLADREKEIDRLQKEMLESKKQTGEERSSKETVERKFSALQKRVYEIEQQPPTLDEKVIIKEVAKVEKDPQMEEDLRNLSKMLEDEKKKNKAAKEEINLVQKKYITLEQAKPKEVVKADPEVEKMAAILKKQLADEQQKRRDNEKELERLQKEMLESKKQTGEERSSKETVERNFAVLQKRLNEIEKQPPTLDEKVIIKEVAKIEKDPQMEEDLKNLRKMLESEYQKNKAAHEEVTLIQNKYLTLEQSKAREIVKPDPNTERKVMSLEKQFNNEQRRLQEAENNLSTAREEILRLRNRPPEVKLQDVIKVERDPQQDKEISELQYQVQEEKDTCHRLEREVTFLKEKLIIIENTAPKVEVKEVLREVVKPDPKTEQRAANLSKQLEKEKCLGENLKTEINNLHLEIVKLQNKEPEVHIQEVVKLEQNPQTLEELSRLKELLDDEIKKSSNVKRQLLNLQSNYDTLATEKAKVEVKEVVREVIRPDPETEKVTSHLRIELQRMKREVGDRNMDIENLKEQIIALKNKPPAIQTKEIIKEIVKYERSATDEEELSNIRDDFDKESKKRMDAELEITKLHGKIFNLENRQPEIQEKVVVQKSVEYKTDPALEDKVNSFQRALEQEQKLHHLAEENLRDTRERVTDQLTEIKLLNEQLKNKYQIEHELKQLELQIAKLKKQKEEAENNVQIKEVVKFEKDPTVVEEANNLRYELQNEKRMRNNIENDNQNLMAKVRELEMQGEKEKIVYQEVVKIERDEAVDQELSKFKSLYHEETELSRSKQVEIERLAMQLSKLIEDMEGLRLRVTDNELLISSKDMELVQLLRKVNDQEDKQEKEKIEEMRKSSHICKRVTVVHPDTGIKLSPYEAYKANLIDWNTYEKLQNQEKEWELITITGSKGKSTILRDHKSGQEYSIDEAIKQGFISENDIQRYEGGELSITDIAAKIAGPAEDILDRFKRGQKIESHELFYAIAVAMLSEGHPIAGVYDMSNETKMSVQSAVHEGLIDTQTGQRLLEAQAATGGIIDINTTEKCSVHQALDRGLVRSSDIQKLISAQKAFTGIEDAVTRERLSVGEALQRGWLYEDAAYRYLEAQHVTGGLVDPSKSGRVPAQEAKEKGTISSAVESHLNDETSYIKDITDPLTKEQITYKQALDNCTMDESTGLPLLKANAEAKPLLDF
uniref:plectin-like n=1 Tax=Myxine glutinosa TaxID=7769 RepID=UPI00358E45A4